MKLTVECECGRKLKIEDKGQAHNSDELAKETGIDIYATITEKVEIRCKCSKTMAIYIW